MSIKTSMVSCIRIPATDDLDPITVYLENYEPGKGKITIESWGKAWSSAWPAMSVRSVEQFFVDAGVPYLAGYLDNDAKPEILNPDMDELRAALCQEVFAYRRTDQFDKTMARDLYDRAQEVEIGEGHCSDYGLMSALYGDCWYEGSLPPALQVPNQKYVTLCKIIEAVKVGLKECIHQQTDRFYLQDGRGHDGNMISWWRKGGAGYTANLTDAETFTKDEALAQNKTRATDIPWPVAYLAGKTFAAVDFQEVDVTEALEGTGITLCKRQAADEAESPNREGLTVWRGQSPRLGFDHVIAIVAARTKEQAMEIFGLQPHEFDRLMTVTSHPQCLEVALAAPGVVFHAKRLREDGWWAFRAVRHE